MFFGGMIFVGGPRKVPPTKIKVFLQPGKIDFRKQMASSTPVYIFVGGHLAPRVMSA
jgi:hypothetical protein